VTDFVLEASKLAAQFHQGQKYGNLDYFEGHIDSVATQADVIAYGLKFSSEEIRHVVAAAYLHDILEDTFCEAKTLLEKGIPHVVVTAVGVLTKGCESKSQYLAAISCSRIATVVKLADSMVNLRACIADGKFVKALKYSDNINFLTTVISRWSGQ